MEKLVSWIWGPQSAVLLLVGVVMTLRSGCVQLRKWRQIAAVSAAPADKSGVSPFQAVCMALAGTVGTGNIAGVAGAVALGGPGAVFWMWVSAFFGMATKYAEVVLAMRYRVKDSRGQWLGGPMYYISMGMGRKWNRMAAFFAFSAVIVSMAMGNVVQTHTIADSVRYVAAVWAPQWDPRTVVIVTGAAAAIVVAGITLGGAVRIGKTMEKLMPLLAAVYLLGAMAVLVSRRALLPQALRQILQGAFMPQAVVGGAAGIGLRQAIQRGVSRGVFSNEAGLGSAPMAHASATAEPEQQGLMGIFEVFFDTIILCTLTALTILVSGVPIAYGEAAGAELASAALGAVFGDRAAIVLAVVLVLLALGSMISWNYYGSCCASYLWGETGLRIYQLVFPAVTLLGATMELSVVWTAADLCNSLMTLPNLIALLALQKQIWPQRSAR